MRSSRRASGSSHRVHGDSPVDPRVDVHVDTCIACEGEEELADRDVLDRDGIRLDRRARLGPRSGGGGCTRGGMRSASGPGRVGTIGPAQPAARSVAAMTSVGRDRDKHRGKYRGRNRGTGRGRYRGRVAGNEAVSPDPLAFIAAAAARSARTAPSRPLVRVGVRIRSLRARASHERPSGAPRPASARFVPLICRSRPARHHATKILRTGGRAEQGQAARRRREFVPPFVGIGDVIRRHGQRDP